MAINEPHVSLRNIDSIQQFEALFNYATIGIVVTDHEGKIINFNKFAENQFGYTRQELIGGTVDILLPKPLQANHVKYREQYYANPKERVMGQGRDLFARSKDGEIFPVEVSLSHYFINGETYVIAFVIDITVRKKQETIVLQQKEELERVATEIKRINSELEQKVEDRTKMLREALVELERSKEELNEAFEVEKELNELKSRFVTTASHEFRTPLSTILSSAYLLEKYNGLNPDAKVQKHLHRIMNAVGGMKSILENLLSLGKLEEGLVQTKMETIHANEFISQINNLVQELDALLKPGQKIELNNTVEEDVVIDSTLLKHILINLVSNAIKFTGDNSTITISSSLTNGELIISVKDTGIGISKEDQQHLFERFFRARNAGNIEGTGLGLHIVDKYLKLMNGRIDIKSKIDEGSTFTIYIPQEKNNEKEV